MIRQWTLIPALQPLMLMSLKVGIALFGCRRGSSHRVHLKACCTPLLHAFFLLCTLHSAYEVLHASGQPPVHAKLQGYLCSRGSHAVCVYIMLVPAHADMPRKAEAEQQAPASLQGPRIRRSRRVTRDSRVATGQASACTGRGTKRHAEQCDETADAPQPKRQRGEPQQPDCQQASEEAPIPPISAAPAPAVTEAPAAARDPSADLRVCS